MEKNFEIKSLTLEEIADHAFEGDNRYVRAGDAQKALDSLRNMRALAIPGMDWTDEIGQAALAECDAAIAALAAKE